MRRYYSASGARATDPRTQLDNSQELHWALLGAYLSGVPACWRPSVRRLLDHCIKCRDVIGLVQASRIIESYLTKYDRSTTISAVRHDRQTVALLKKFPFRPSESPFDRRGTAIDKWLNAEIKCEETNERLGSLRKEELPQFIWRAKELIFRVLGELTAKKLMYILDSGNHGPGSTLSSNGNRVTEYYKYLDLPYTVTESAKPYAYAAISQSPRWLEFLESSGRRKEVPPPHASRAYRELQILNECVEVVDSDKVTFVPKDVKTDRPIAVGASLNIFLQLGVKTYLERRLALFGVDLTDQQRNQDLAFAGSKFSFVDGSVNENQFSTIDLASASDTISNELVKLLLPPEWYAFLDDLRHKSGVVDGELFIYEKFSAMGNGFTFPLESLIFWAVSKAAIEVQGYTCHVRDIAVFGDDIIVRFKHAQSVIQALTWCGFEVNKEKSFLDGYFKESCGADYFKGYNVRPFYLKREVITHADIYHICNSITLIGRISGYCPGLCSLYNYCLGLIPKAKRRFTPLSQSGESGLMVPFSFMSDIGLRPYLHNSESQHLRSRRLLCRSDSYLQSCYWIDTSVRAISYKGISQLLYYLSLRRMERPFTPGAYTRDLVIHEAMAQGVVTRRKATRYVTKVRPVSDWNGDFTLRETASHPIYWVI